MPRTALFLLALSCTAADWPQFLGPTRDGTAPDAAVSATWPQAGPPKLWEHPVGSGWAGPVAVGGRVVVAHRVGNEQVVDCLNALTGKVVWTHKSHTRYSDDFQFDDGPRATPAIADGTVYVVGTLAEVTAIDLTTGREKWRRELGAEFKAAKGFFGVAGSPLVAGGRVLLNLGAKGAGVLALKCEDGTTAWQATDHAAGYSSPALATLNGRPTAVFLTRLGLLGVDAETGEVRFEREWKARISASVNAATPIVRGDTVFVTSSYQVGALSTKVGLAWSLSEVWSNDESLSCHYNTPVESGGLLFGVHGRQEEGPELRCVEWATGKVRWSKADFGCAGLIRAGGTVLALTEGGDVVAFAAEKGAYRELARTAVLGPKTRAAPALAGGVLYARGEGRLVALDLRK